MTQLFYQKIFYTLVRASKRYFTLVYDHDDGDDVDDDDDGHDDLDEHDDANVGHAHVNVYQKVSVSKR